MLGRSSQESRRSKSSSEVMDALRIRQQAEDSALFFELTYLDPTSLTDFLAVLDLLDHARQGYFDTIHIVPSASTWSRSRHSGLPGQPPLRSRSSPLGLSSLSPEETEKIHSANRVLEIAAWQTLQCLSKVIGFTLIFPEDLGGHKSHGPSSLWVLREFQLLEGTRDVRRAAGYLCQFNASGLQASDWCPLPIVFNFEKTFVFGLALF